MNNALSLSCPNSSKTCSNECGFGFLGKFGPSPITTSKIPLK
jgi:hypothetical protein